MTPKEKHEAIVAVGRRLGEKMAEFAGDFLGHKLMEDRVLEPVDIENFREEIERAVAAGFEYPQAEYMLATAIAEPEERLRALFRVLQSLHKSFEAAAPGNFEEWWDRCLVYAFTYYELGVLHARMGRTVPAGDSFERALSYTHSLRSFRPGITGPPPEFEDELEGKITLAMLSLEARK